MELLNFNKANCKHCYKCLRVCPVKAIKFVNDQASIVEERCIACGHCFIACPQNARKVHSDIENIKVAIGKGQKVIATLAPSFVASFPIKEGGQVVSALKKLGFSHVEETAIGADIVSKLYREELSSGQYKNIITTACSSSNILVEKYYPELLDYMLPVVTPMIAHGKVLKQKYGMDSFVVFIGPCISKKAEANDPQHNDVIDACLTFEELDTWLKEESIDISTIDSKPFDDTPTVNGRAFPIEGSVLSSFIKNEFKNKYDFISIDGVEECIDILDTLMDENINGVCVELNACKGGCVNGPGIIENLYSPYTRRKRVKKYIAEKNDVSNLKNVIIPKNIHFKKTFINKSFYRPKASEKQIKEILNSIEKFTIEDELNCGACGYSTCREKAQAVLEGMAETSMCLPYMQSKAERLSNHIFENSPIAMLVLDKNLNVIEFNPICEKLFNIEANEILNKPISTIIQDDIFKEVKKTKTDVVFHNVHYPEYEISLLQNIIHIENEDAILAIMTDITAEEKSRKELIKIKENTLEAAQNVIDKQMRVAQEIAGLLGETTAETKVVLTKLKQLVLEDGDFQ